MIAKIKEIEDLLGDKYELYIEDIPYWEYLVAEERLFGPAVIAIRDKKTGLNFTVNINEAHECCGKLYMYEFPGGVFEREFLTIGIEIAKILNYTYLGFVHIKGTHVVNEGLKLGFKPIVEFVNKRSKSILVEMCKIS